MSEIYWIITLGKVSTMLWVIAGALGFAIFFIALFDFFCLTDCEDERAERHFKSIKKLLAPFIISLLLAVFCPSTNQLYVIYGVGGTIDYLQGNETAKQLPDKVVKCLDKWADEALEENNKQ